ncbi:hypothetical protein [Nesterenkonia pannonica]|uniref:hypothetical protein n=1 Tax=Nesterenkonia pannonica TaxID=1548602 RepID=UPI00216404D5|nr:hypothetical protein [Nesterenkonia pannonica]
MMMHDLGYEFRFVQRLLRAGTITAHGTAAEVLSLSEDEYLGYSRADPWPRSRPTGPCGSDRSAPRRCRSHQVVMML